MCKNNNIKETITVENLGDMIQVGGTVWGEQKGNDS